MGCNLSRTRYSAALAVLTALALSTAGCSGGRGQQQSSPAAAPLPRSATKNQINPMTRDKIQDGGTFTVPLDRMPANFNYHELDGSEVSTSHVIAALMPTAFTSDAAGTPLWSRDYLTSEPTLVTDPEQIVTYEINPKAVWYDGTPITWDDLFWQWKANNGTNKAYNI